MHDIKNERSPLFGKDRSNPYSVNQRGRIVCVNQVDHVVINPVNANDAVCQRIDRGIMVLELPYPRLCQKDALSRDLHRSIAFNEADDANSLWRNVDSAATGTPYPTELCGGLAMLQIVGITERLRVASSDPEKPIAIPLKTQG
ncbi:MAG: hypothetical protein FJY85_18490 [Deltaproteobacteria bacterium]|nr:hypothetical protein [Deltaproteobacteria bacterium]